MALGVHPVATHPVLRLVVVQGTIKEHRRVHALAAVPALHSVHPVNVRSPVVQVRYSVEYIRIVRVEVGIRSYSVNAQ